MIREDMTVVSHREIADGIFELKLQGGIAAQIASPGQFVHIRVAGASDSVAPLLRRPVSICSADSDLRQLTLIYRRLGMGTKLLTKAAPGDEIDVLGPLGHGYPVDVVSKGGRALIIGGGVGVPPLYGLSQALSARGAHVMHILGFRSAKDVFYENEFSGLGDTTIVTEDGTAGCQGLVTDVLDQFPFDTAFACGPLPMLKAVQNRVAGRPLYLSLEQRMGCGVGACLACAIRTTDPSDTKGYRRVCCDGPVFKAGEVELC